MKITVYTITDCQFSKQEKEYLASHQLQYEEKNLETNKDWLTEMLAVSNNFAGTPVTKIEKDDGTIVILKGFTKEEFDTTLGFAQPNNQSPNNDQNTTQTTPPAQSTDQTMSDVTTPPVQPVVPPTTTEPTTDPLASVLEDLQTKVASDATNVNTTPPPTPNPTTDSTPPVSPPTDTASAPLNTSDQAKPATDQTTLPKIPDFQ